MRSARVRAWAAAGTLALALALAGAGCSSTAVFDDALAEDLEARLGTSAEVRCDHEVRDLWLCTYEPDPGSDSYAELMVRRGAGDCWTGRRSRIAPGQTRPYSRGSLSWGRHQAVGRVLRGCA